MERRRTGGMTAIAVLNIVFGGLEILSGLFQLLGSLMLIFELARLGVFAVPTGRLMFAVLVLATGVVGLVAGIGVFSLRPWARILSLVYGGLAIVTSISSYFAVPIIYSIGSYDLSAVNAVGLVRLVIFCTIYIVIPIPYGVALWVMFCRSGWKIAFARGSTV